MEWDVTIGLEVHAQLATNSKIFSGASTSHGALPNIQTCPLDLGMPGTLPVLNETAVRMAVKFGLAVGSEITPHSVFARKNYFYPDLPKGYQISQFDLPIVSGGHMDIPLENGKIKRIGITRAHLEEDAGKSLHEDFQGMTGIDLNRAGIPLLEIVSEPDLSSAAEAVTYLKRLHTLVRYLGICDGNMQEGSFRCDANVSIRPKGQVELGTRTETKNVNSFRFVEKAINYEIERQRDILEGGGKIAQETRLYDADKNETRSMRSKEEANDYRYFPDPDLLPVTIPVETIEAIRKQLPELPDQKQERLKTTHQLSDYDAGVLVSNIDLANYFEETASSTQAPAKLVVNWIMGDFSSALNKENKDINDSPVSPKQLAELLNRIHDNTISGKIAKTIFEAIWAGEGSADDIIAAKGLKQMTDEGEILAIINHVLDANPTQLEQYRQGQVKLFGFFVGQVMKETQGKANPQQLNTLLKGALSGD